MPSTGQEMYAQTQHFGTSAAAMTKMDKDRYYFGGGNLNAPYCCQLAGILRILEIVTFNFGKVWMRERKDFKLL